MSGQLPSIALSYPKAVCHLNYAKRTDQLGIVLGSGVSDALALPKWRQLLEKLEIQLGYPIGESYAESYRAEQLFQFYWSKMSGGATWSTRHSQEAATTAGWRKLVSAALYGKYLRPDGKWDLDKYGSAIKGHPYLKQLARLALDLELVVSHNFDDALESAIDQDPTVKVPAGRKYHSFWRPETFLRRPMVNIYHPNGFMPLSADTKGSENIILTEGSFADHLANTNTVETNFFVRYLADRTSIIIGHSLADGTLKNALRIHANQRPGHVNYYIFWEAKSGGGLTPEQRSAIRETNFRTYNLVTIFANSEDIRDLLELTMMSDAELEGKFAHHGLCPCYVYYIAGAVSSGKSTVIGNLRNLATVEEWPARMPVAMNRPSIGLENDVQREIDAQLEEAIWIKNDEINKNKVGVVAVDRAPLDFLAFPVSSSETMEETARNRTGTVLKRFEAGRFARLARGHVILIKAESDALLERQLRRSRVSSDKIAEHKIYLSKQQDLMSRAYPSSNPGVTIVDADGCSAAASVKQVARIVHLEEYQTVDFAGVLSALRSGEGDDAAGT